MLTKKFVKRSFTFKFYVKVWSCNRPLSLSEFMLAGCLLKEEVKENSMFGSHELSYIFIT